MHNNNKRRFVLSFEWVETKTKRNQYWSEEDLRRDYEARCDYFPEEFAEYTDEEEAYQRYNAEKLREPREYSVSTGYVIEYYVLSIEEYQLNEDGEEQLVSSDYKMVGME